MLKGITIRLFRKEKVEEDDFGAPIFQETAIDVDNVLVGEPTSEEVTDTLNLTGRKAVYVLGIPKGDTNDWENVHVEFFGQRFRTIGIPIEGIESMIPLSWNKKVKVERYGEDQDQS